MTIVLEKKTLINIQSEFKIPSVKKRDQKNLSKIKDEKNEEPEPHNLPAAKQQARGVCNNKLRQLVLNNRKKKMHLWAAQQNLHLIDGDLNQASVPPLFSGIISISNVKEKFMHLLYQPIEQARDHSIPEKP